MSAADEHPRRDPPRILLVDDDEAILFAMRDYLTNRGYRVDCVREAHAAFERLAAIEYPLVVSDLCLTGSGDQEGLDILAHARERQPGIRTVLLTAYGSPETERAARERGVDAVLNKPMPLADVAALVFQLLRADTPDD